ncbi:MAG: 50S ribosomal protein L3 [Methylothermaceae bacteria B42]|nr:MAG: 50S ribosomal protein L3 [Methylothermaceae bacteria B42]HHJ40047.1 50S ribosomal protein L3 [Methylothermaceae bacterium]
MTIGIVGRKCGMTRMFTEDGQSVPVTVIQVEENRVAQVKTAERDGYSAVQVTTGAKKTSRIPKPEAGHFAKAGVSAGRGLWEFRLREGEELEVGATIDISIFEEGQYVDVVGTTIGKGFAGPIKKYNFRSQDATHGNSLSHRAPGSIGQCQTPGRVFKGKKMAGRMGNVRRTAQNLQIVAVDKDKNILMIKGAVPGHKGSDVIVRPAVKKTQG